MLDWNNVFTVASGGNFTYTVENDGFYLIQAYGYESRVIVSINGIGVAFGGNVGGNNHGWQSDHNFILLNKGDIITSRSHDSGGRIDVTIIYVPFK